MLKIYNTYSREKEEFKAMENTVKIYTCGPTVYNYAHIGNLRAYIFMDILRKTLKINGYKLNHVMNITDVGHLTSDADEGEDKMLKASREQKLSPYEIAKIYTEKFLNDISKLNIEEPEHIVKATDHIKEMEEYVKEIVKNGYGYETSKGVYFDTKKDVNYGELSKVKLEDNLAGARIEVDREKRNSADFAIWIKAPENHIMKWESEFGLCYPGWHIECSAMGRKYLGNVMDIHTGGVDHIPIHHENEIAQSRGCTGENPAKYWMHSEFLLIDGGKMSKSLGNVYTIKDLEDKGYTALDYRYLSYSSHYRNKLNFTWEGLESAKIALNKLKLLYKAHTQSSDDIDESIIIDYRDKFLNAINDDLNIPMAMGVVWELSKLNKSNNIAKLLKEFDNILSLNIDKIDELNKEMINLPKEIEDILEARKNARLNKNFEMSDVLRDELLSKVYKVLDTKDGQQIEKI